MKTQFNVNQIVAGKVAGIFVILGFRMIDGKTYAQLKRYCTVTKKTARGELALPVDALKEVI
jgi:hypothetical protein